MKKLLIILVVIFLFSCNKELFIIENKTMISSEYLELSLPVTKKELKKIVRRYNREGYSLTTISEKTFIEAKNNDIFIIIFTKEEIEATVKNKGRRSILHRKYNERLKTY